MSNFDRIKNMLKGSTTMPQGTAGGNVHYHDGVACTHDHSHDHDNAHGHDHAHHSDGSCCEHEETCSHKDHK